METKRGHRKVTGIHDTRHETEHKCFDKPDEVREFPNGRAEILNIGGGEVGRFVFQPGWRWSNDVKPIAKTDSCEAPHFQYHVSGRLGDQHGRRHRVRSPGPATSPRCPSGHDGWVVGDEPAVVVDWYGASTYAKTSHDKGRRLAASVAPRRLERRNPVRWGRGQM